MTGFRLQPLGQVMEPEPGNPLEVEGVLNPESAFCSDRCGNSTGRGRDQTSPSDQVRW